MGIIPIMTAARLLPILTRAGFRIVRQAGSHLHLEHMIDKSKRITVPIHKGKDLAKKTLLSILKQAKIPFEDFLKILGRK